ncbi:MAG TPA: hypothetical protein VMC09_03795 [Anaerolineales bacterium]|nr:hypothetical protein [Anaerolineales bacterium]
MNSLHGPSRFTPACLAALLLVLIAAACAPKPVPPAIVDQAVVQTVVVDQAVTQVVTSEVTRLVDEPVTLTPTLTPTLAETATPTPSPTRTHIPSATPTWNPPLVAILKHAGCWYGPSTAYLYKYGLNATVWMRVIGRNEDGSWVAVKAGDDKDSNACWIQTDLVKFISGDIKSVPELWIALPYSVLYPVKGWALIASANRVGNKVTVFFRPIWMTEDDYRGYLIEAWVCQGGKQVFVPVGYVTDYYQNQALIARGGMATVEITDEPGCDVPSRARFYAVEKHGYTSYIMIPWPGFDSSPTATATP